MPDLIPTRARRTLQQSLATSELWLGILVIFASFIYQVADTLGFPVRLNGIFELLPLAVLWSGCLLTVAGGLMRQFPQYPVLAQFPLLLWIAVLLLAFGY